MNVANRGGDGRDHAERTANDPVRFGAVLRRARLEACLLQRDLAEAAGVTAAYVSRIEAGARVPKRRVLKAFAARLGVDPEQLLNEPLSSERVAAINETTQAVAIAADRWLEDPTDAAAYGRFVKAVEFWRAGNGCLAHVFGGAQAVADVDEPATGTDTQASSGVD